MNEKDTGTNGSPNRETEWHDSRRENWKCPHCGQPMIKSRNSILQSIKVYWQKPWGTIIKMDEPVIPFACVNCGYVMMMLRDHHKVSNEWNRLSDEERKKVLKEQ